VPLSAEVRHDSGQGDAAVLQTSRRPPACGRASVGGVVDATLLSIWFIY